MQVVVGDAGRWLPSRRRIRGVQMSMGLAGYEVLAWIEGAACLCCAILVIGVLTSVQAAAHCRTTLLALCTPAT